MIEDAKDGSRVTKPKPAFTTDTMLQAAGSSLGWGVGKTMTVAGALYNSGFITCVQILLVQIRGNQARSFIESKWVQIIWVPRVRCR